MRFEYLYETNKIISWSLAWSWVSFCFEIRKIEMNEGIKIRYNPILLGGLHNLHGIKAPAFIPAKAKTSGNKKIKAF